MLLVQYLSGIFLAVGVYFTAFIIHKYTGWGEMSMAIVLGLLLSYPLKSKIEKNTLGLTFIEKKFLTYSIILCGFSITWGQLQKMAYPALPLIIMMIILLFLLPKLLGKQSDFSLLLSAGFGICGSNAIASVASIIKPKNLTDITLAVLFTHLLGLIGVFLWPFLFHHFFQDWDVLLKSTILGGSLPAVSHVVAASQILADIPDITQTSIGIKMARVTLLIPLLIILTFIYEGKSLKKVKIPPVIIGLIITILLNHFITLPALSYRFISESSKIMFNLSITAMALMTAHDFSIVKIFKQLSFAAFLYLSSTLFLSFGAYFWR